jgi:hypothetical protein
VELRLLVVLMELPLVKQVLTARLALGVVVIEALPAVWVVVL